MESPPQYQQPALDPGYAELMAQSRQQDVDAINARMRSEEASLTARYGTLTSGDHAAILARYGAQLAMAQGSSEMLQGAQSLVGKKLDLTAYSPFRPA